MPYKSKKNRRVSRNPVASVSSGTAEKVSPAVSANQPARPVYSSFSKTQSAAVPVETHFLSELKWIGLVTVIIVVLLIVAYYLFR